MFLTKLPAVQWFGQERSGEGDRAGKTEWHGVGSLALSWHICEHLSKWQLKRNSRTFHMATHPGWVSGLDQAGCFQSWRGGAFYPRAAEPVRLQEGITKGVPQPIVSSVSLSREFQLVATVQGT